MGSLFKALAKLSAQDREAILLRYSSDLTMSEIAEIIDSLADIVSGIFTATRSVDAPENTISLAVPIFELLKERADLLAKANDTMCRIADCSNLARCSTQAMSSLLLVENVVDL